MTRNDDTHYFHRVLLEHISEGVVIVDQQGIIRQFNPAAEQILHTRCAHVLGQPLLAFCRTDSVYAVWEQRLRHYLDNPALLQDAEAELLLINRFVRARIRPIFDDRHRCLGLIFFLANEQTGLQATSPLQGYTDLLLMGAAGALTDKQTGILSSIREGVTYLTEMIDAVFSIAYHDVENTSAFEAVQISVIVPEIVKALLDQDEYDVKNFDITINVSDRTPVIYSDEHKLRRVIKSIVQNAFDYTLAHGKITVTVTPTANRDHIIISVEDNGIGIPKEFHNRIWQRYPHEQPNAVFALEAPGKGAGLSIARALVELLDGEIWFVSEYGIGTIFYVSLPVNQPLPQPVRQRIYD